MEQVILVDEKDTNIGLMEKIEAHRQGRLHRAFSIVLFNSNGEILLQQRSYDKYHSAGLWSNTCCSHPRPGEDLKDATARRLREEMGIHVPLEFNYKFIYKVRFGELTEHEFDHVYTGIFNGTPDINPDEVADWKFMDPAEIMKDMYQDPSRYSAWFKMIMHRLTQTAT